MFSLPFTIIRNITIKCSLDKIFETIADFNTWKNWSPWLCQEKDCLVEISGQPSQIGHQQIWDGKLIGTGKMELVGITNNRELNYVIKFVKPWKSQSQVSFKFQEVADGVNVQWIMNGSVPIFLFFMRRMFSSLVGSDYERGLSMLKEWLETDQILSDSEIKGKVIKESFYYLGIREQCAFDEIPQKMQTDFKLLADKLEHQEINPPKSVISLYHEFDLVNQTCEFTCAYAYDSPPENQNQYENGEFPAHQVAQVLHTGSYQNLGNAWSTAINYQRGMKMKANKSIPWYELYVNDPNRVEAKDLKTEINIPVQ